MVQVKLPELGENIETAEVSQLLVSEGDTIQVDQNVMELESEKASFGLPSPNAGRVAKIHVKQGDIVSVGQTLLDIDDSKGAQPQGQQKEPAKRQSANGEGAALPQTTAEGRPDGARLKEPISQPKAPPRPNEEPREPVSPVPAAKPAHVTDDAHGDGERKAPVPAGPATRRLARELGVDLHQVAGSEAGGRISRDDVKAHARARVSGGARAADTPALPDFARWGTVKRQRLSSIARTTAERLSLAWRLIPHVTQHELADITELEEARNRYNEKRPQGQAKITPTVLAIPAVVAALKAFPQFNSSLDTASGELILKEYYHIGVAVDTPHGLLVVVLRDADRKTPVQLAAELAQLAEKARNRTLAPAEMEGGTFTISNLGVLGGTAFTPIINYPEVAILGISRSRWERVIRDGKGARRLLMPLSLSYDHRVINGADGVRFIERIAELLSGPFKLLAES